MEKFVPLSRVNTTVPVTHIVFPTSSSVTDRAGLQSPSAGVVAVEVGSSGAVEDGSSVDVTVELAVAGLVCVGAGVTVALIKGLDPIDAAWVKLGSMGVAEPRSVDRIVLVGSTPPG
jgi:hypothetical protein